MFILTYLALTYLFFPTIDRILNLHFADSPLYHAGYGSSNGMGGKGVSGDCGYLEPYVYTLSK